MLGALNHAGPGTGEVCYRSCCVTGHTGEAVQGPRDPFAVGPIPAGAVPTVGSRQGRRGPCLSLFSVPPACADGGSEAARVSGKGSGLEGVRPDPTPLQGSRVCAEKSGGSPTSEFGSQAHNWSLCS